MTGEGAYEASWKIQANGEIERDKRGQITRHLVWDGQGHKYVYDQSGKLVAVKRAGKPESLALESHGVSSGLLSRFWQAPDFAPDSECFFMSDFGGSILDAGSYSCNDPFGEFGSGYGGGYDYGGGGGGSGWDYFDPTTVDSECVKREEAACSEQFKACGNRAFGEFAAEAIACVIIAITTENLFAAILCMTGAIMRVGGMMGRIQVAFNMAACEGEYRACKLRIPNTCRR